jgi:hypothetical protein
MSKAKRAAEAIAANPQMSDRAIAEELGVGVMTVGRARKKSTVPHGTVDTEPRVGLDGKTRRMPTRDASDVTEDGKTYRIPGWSETVEEALDDESADRDHDEGLRVIAARGASSDAPELNLVT